MRRSKFWPMALAGLSLGTLGMIGGTTVGGELRPMIVGYGLLIALAALYLVAGLAIRERVWQRMSQPTADRPRPERLVGRRVF